MLSSSLFCLHFNNSNKTKFLLGLFIDVQHWILSELFQGRRGSGKEDALYAHEKVKD